LGTNFVARAVLKDVSAWSKSNRSTFGYIYLIYGLKEYFYYLRHSLMLSGARDCWNPNELALGIELMLGLVVGNIIQSANTNNLNIIL